MTNLLSNILNASTVSEITDILEQIHEEYSTHWIPVGGRPNNLATINIGTDPAAGLTERITNAIDATLEKEWIIRGKPDNINSPRTAVKEWFKIPNGRLSEVTDIREFDKLSRSIVISLKESEKTENPTVEIRDHGLGIEGKRFGDTILSLNGSNKLNKLFLLGAFGQGGSTALSFNNYTIIISRPYFNSKGEANTNKTVFFTIVRVNPGDINKDKQEWFEYIVDDKTNVPIAIEDEDNVFEPGTLVKHIAMEIGKYRSAVTQLTGSLWYLCHNYLFDTVVPFTIRDERKRLTKDKIENRTVSGNNRRLSREGSNTEYKRTVPLTFRDGHVQINYWVIDTEGTDDPASRITLYTLKSQPIIITFNGQKQGYMPNTVIRNDLKLPFLEGYLVVQIECDKLDNEAKRQLFSSTRESLRDTNILDELRKLIFDTLKEDEELIKLDHKRKQRYLKKDDNEATEKLRKRLANRINVFLKEAGKGEAVQPAPTPGTNPGGKKLEPIPVQEPPTFLTITTPDEKEVYPGKSFSIKFKTDAHSNHFVNPDSFLAISSPHSLCSYTGNANVLNGHGIAYFKVADSVALDTAATLTLELRPRNQKSLSDSINVVTVVFPETADSSKKGDKSVPNIIPQFIGEDDPLYKDEKWTPESVAKVSVDHESVTIWVSSANKHLEKLVTRARKRSDEAVKSIQNYYLEHISFFAYMNYQARMSKSLAGNTEGENVSEEVISRLSEADLKHAGETVCGMLTDLFDYVVTAAVAEEIQE